MIDFLKQRQYWHHQVKISAQAWAKISEIRDKMVTSEFVSGAIVASIVANRDRALSISRYDVDHNDQDRSIHRFFLSQKDGKQVLVKELNLPICLTYKDLAIADPAVKTPSIIVHLLTDQVGFISSKSEEVNETFLCSFLE